MSTLMTTASGLAIPTPERDDLPDWKRCAAAFLIRYRNANTRQNYAKALEVWFRWCRDHGLDPLRSVKRHHVEHWMRHMEDVEGKAPTTVVHRLNALSGYYKIAVMDGYIDGSPVFNILRPRIERVSTTNYLTRVELGRVFQVAEERGDNRDLAILCLLGLNGLRCSEVVGIDIEDLGRERGYKTIFVRRKADRTQTIPLSPRTTWAIEQCVGDRTSGPLFVSKRTANKRIERGDVQRLVKRYTKWAGITHKRISPHSFRHSFVTLSLDAGVSARDVQNSAGHADARMTSYYDRNRESLARNATHTLTAFVEGAI